MGLDSTIGPADLYGKARPRIRSAASQCDGLGTS